MQQEQNTVAELRKGLEESQKAVSKHREKAYACGERLQEAMNETSRKVQEVQVSIIAPYSKPLASHYSSSGAAKSPRYVC